MENKRGIKILDVYTETNKDRLMEEKLKQENERVKKRMRVTIRQMASETFNSSN